MAGRWSRAIVLALALCFVIGWLLGYPALRVQHHYLAFVTLAFSTLAFLVFRNEAWLTDGTDGIDGVPRPVDLRRLDRRRISATIISASFVLALVTLAMLGLVRSPWGRAFVALARKSASGAVARRRHAALYADGVRDRLGARRPRRRALCAARRPRRAARLHAVALAQSADDGDRRRLRLFPRAVPRRAGRGAAARMAALSPRTIISFSIRCW